MIVRQRLHRLAVLALLFAHPNVASKSRLADTVELIFQPQPGEKLGLTYDQSYGVVNSVVSGSKAAERGVKVGSKITKVNGSPFSHESVVACAEAARKPGGACKLIFLSADSHISAGELVFDIFKKTAKGDSTSTADSSNNDNATTPVEDDPTEKPAEPTENSGEATGFWAKWEQVKEYVNPDARKKKKLEYIQKARTPKEFGLILEDYAGDAEVLEALIEKIKQFEAKCKILDDVARLSWMPPQIDMKAKEKAARYLRYCRNNMDLEMERDILEAAVELLQHASDTGSTVKVSPEVVVEAFGFLEDFLETATETMSAGLPAATHKVVKQTLWMEGSATPCKVLSALVRRAKPNSTILDSRTISIWDLDELRRLQRKKKRHYKMDSEEEACLDTLTSDYSNVLTPDEPLADVIRPGEKANAAGRALHSHDDLDQALKDRVVGQDCIIDELADSPGYVKLKMKGLWSKHKPLVLLFLGPSGVGKTMLASFIAEAIHQKPSSQLRAEGLLTVLGMDKFSTNEDKSNLFGPPTGTVGESQLGNALRKSPNAVVVLDEIEKAHPDLARMFTSALGEDGFADAKQQVPSNQATFILTSNLARDLVHERVRQDESILSPRNCSGFETMREEVNTYLKKYRLEDGSLNFFKDDEVRGRLTGVFPFLPFDLSAVENAVHLFLSDLVPTLPDMTGNLKHVSLAWEPEVVSHLSQHYLKNREEGMRAVRKHAEYTVKDVMLKALEAGLMKEHSEVVLRVLKGSSDDDKLDLRIVFNPNLVSKLTSTPSQGSTKPSPGNEARSPSMLGATAPTSPGVTGSSMPGASGGKNWHMDYYWDKDKDFQWSFLQAWQWLFAYVWEKKFAFMLGAGAIVLAAVAAPAIGVAVPGAAALGTGVLSAGSSVFAVVGTAATGLIAAPLALPAIGVGTAALAAGAASWYFGSLRQGVIFFVGVLLVLVFACSPLLRKTLFWILGLPNAMQRILSKMIVVQDSRRTELRQLSLRTLMKRAADMGVPEKVLDKAGDAADAKAAYIDLILKYEEDKKKEAASMENDEATESKEEEVQTPKGEKVANEEDGDDMSPGN